MNLDHEVDFIVAYACQPPGGLVNSVEWRETILAWFHGSPPPVGTSKEGDIERAKRQLDELNAQVALAKERKAKEVGS